MDHLVHVAAEQVFRGEAKHAERGAVDEGAAAIEIDAPDTFAGGVQERLPGLVGGALRSGVTILRPTEWDCRPDRVAWMGLDGLEVSIHFKHPFWPLCNAGDFWLDAGTYA